MNLPLNTENEEVDGLTQIQKQILLELQYILKTCQQIEENLKMAINMTDKEQGELHRSQALAIESMKIWEKISKGIF